MKKVLLVLLVSVVMLSCAKEEDDDCNPNCWTVINKKTSALGNNTYSFSLKIVRNCSENSEWKRVYLSNSYELDSYELGDSICGDSVPN